MIERPRALKVICGVLNPQSLKDGSPMTLDQEIQVWAAIGTWFAGLGTLAAVIVALYLAKRVEKVRLRVHAGLRVVVLGDGSPFQRHLCSLSTSSSSVMRT
jgi:hypothetical protein